MLLGVETYVTKSVWPMAETKGVGEAGDTQSRSQGKAGEQEIKRDDC